MERYIKNPSVLLQYGFCHSWRAATTGKESARPGFRKRWYPPRKGKTARHSARAGLQARHGSKAIAAIDLPQYKNYLPPAL
jgi:hypothetical protein